MDEGDATPAPLVLRLREFETIDVPADALWSGGSIDVYPSVGGSGFFEFRVNARRLRIQAGGHIGIIPINSRLTLEIVPRAPLGNLSRLLEVAGYAPKAVADAYRLYDATNDMYPSLAVIYARALREGIEQIVGLGFMKTYDRIESNTSMPRGRFQVTRTIQANAPRGIAHRAVVSWFHRSVDNCANRCLLYAVIRLSSYVHQAGAVLSTKQRRGIDRDLNYCWHQLQGVTLDWSEGFLRDGEVLGTRPLPQLRGYYRPVLDLALLVIGRRALALERADEGAVYLPSLVVDMTKVFEVYVRRLLEAAARRQPRPVAVLDGNVSGAGGARGLLFDARASDVDGVDVVVTPDVVIRSGDETLIVEVKYKPALGPPTKDDLAQTITYGASYRARNVVVVQPRAEGSARFGLRRLGTIEGLTAFQYVLDLASDGLDAAERNFTDAMLELV